MSDTGDGVPADELPRMFERFWKSNGHRAGTGLGLYIAESIVVAHGGTITAESKPGDGTAVHFTLPVFVETTGSKETP